jgi:hypothetical protein
MIGRFWDKDNPGQESFFRYAMLRWLKRMADKPEKIEADTENAGLYGGPLPGGNHPAGPG